MGKRLPKLLVSNCSLSSRNGDFVFPVLELNPDADRYEVPWFSRTEEKIDLSKLRKIWETTLWYADPNFPRGRTLIPYYVQN